MGFARDWKQGLARNLALNPVILFDGQCHLCNGFVAFVIRRDPKARFHFAPLQSETGRRLLNESGFQQPTDESVVLIEAGKGTVESTAVLQVFRFLRFPWNLLYGFILVPRPIRDAVYQWVARNRYRWFGKSEICMVPREEWQEMFL